MDPIERMDPADPTDAGARVVVSGATRSSVFLVLL